ncbi:FmdB family zinc ribbon protein [Acidihalobacter prosperus]
MPIYEYRCQACGHELEMIQKMTDQPLVDCPACGKPALKKQISAAGFRLAGGGWYETDFKKDKKRNIAGDPAQKPSKPAADKPDSSKSTTPKSDSPKSAKSA